MIINMKNVTFLNEGYADGRHDESCWNWNEPFIVEGVRYLAIYEIPQWYDLDFDRNDVIDFENPDYVYNQEGEEMETTSNKTGFYGERSAFVDNILKEKLKGFALAGHCSYGISFAYGPSLWDLLVFDDEEVCEKYIESFSYNGNNHTIENVSISEAVEILGLTAQEAEDFEPEIITKQVALRLGCV